METNMNISRYVHEMKDAAQKALMTVPVEGSSIEAHKAIAITACILYLVRKNTCIWFCVCMCLEMPV